MKALDRRRLITPVELFHVRAPGAGSCGGALPHDLEDEHRRGTVGMAAAPRADREGVPPVTDMVRARRRTWLERAPVELALEARAAHVRAEGEGDAHPPADRPYPPRRVLGDPGRGIELHRADVAGALLRTRNTTLIGGRTTRGAPCVDRRTSDLREPGGGRSPVVLEWPEQGMDAQWRPDYRTSMEAV